MNSSSANRRSDNGSIDVLSTFMVEKCLGKCGEFSDNVLCETVFLGKLFRK